MSENDLISKILNALVEPVIVVSSNRYLIAINAAAQEIFNGGAVGADLSLTLRHPSVLRAFADVMAGMDKVSVPLTLKMPLPTTFRMTATRLKNAKSAFGENNDPAVVMSFNDISDGLEAEQMRSDFVTNVSHELRSPITALSGFIETLKGAAKDDPQAQARFLDIMEAEAARMNRLIQDLMSLSKVETMERVRPTHKVELEGLIQGIVNTLEPQAMANTKTIRIANQTKNPTVLGDADQLIQVFQNLIENAIKYSRPGTEITILIAPHSGQSGIAEIVTSVVDKGEGIAAVHLPRLTERFYRVDSGRSRQMGGTGLGLAIVKHILNRHRGRLAVTSEIGVGSNFSVFLPSA
jgi:two-component system, OmpR family, phosphate regulon sensor histidine kinase PhoR